MMDKLSRRTDDGGRAWKQNRITSRVGLTLAAFHIDMNGSYSVHTPYMFLAHNNHLHIFSYYSFTGGKGIIDSMGSNHSTEDIVASRIVIHNSSPGGLYHKPISGCGARLRDTACINVG